MEDLPDSTIQRMAQFLTTEHFTLQGMRSTTVSEANGRLGSFLSAVGSGLVALALVAQLSGAGQAFLAFSIVIFPILIFLGITTSIRLVQVGVTDVLLIQAINRIRNYYLEVTPEADRYFSFPQYDDPNAIRFSLLPFGLGNEQFAGAAVQVAAINSFLAGVFGSILASGLFQITLIPAIVTGLVVLAIVIGLHIRYGVVLQKTFSEHMEIRFPTP